MQNGWTALTFCCMKVSVDGAKIVQLLLSHEANPNTQDEVWYTRACCSQDPHQFTVLFRMVGRRS